MRVTLFGTGDSCVEGDEFVGEENWQPARLIPTSGISGPDEQETRATSALLAVLPVVRDFASALLRPFGAPSGAIETFIEVPLLHADGRTVRPDGVIQISRGQRSWTALVEVKTGNNDLGREQVESYLDIAKDNAFDAVLTISNQIAPAAGVHPVDVDKRKLRKVALHHVSWAEIVSSGVAARPSWSRRSGASVDPRRTDPLSRASTFGCARLHGHGWSMGGRA